MFVHGMSKNFNLTGEVHSHGSRNPGRGQGKVRIDTATIGDGELHDSPYHGGCAPGGVQSRNSIYVCAVRRRGETSGSPWGGGIRAAEASNGMSSDLTHNAGNLSESDRWVRGAFLLFLCGLGGAAAVLLLRDGKESVLLIALASATLLWYLAHLEVKHLVGRTRGWNLLPGYFLPVVVISVVAIAVYLPAIYGYFADDDFAYIHLFRTPSLSQFLRLFHTDLSQGVWGDNRQELRPLFGLSYTLSYSLWGVRPLGYKLSDILLHLLNSLLVFLIVRRIAPDDSWRASFAGLLFAVMPVHWMVVSWVNGSLTEGPPTLFYLSAFLCFIGYRRTGLTRYLVLSATAFAACLLSKETAVTLPVMLISYDLFKIVMGED